MATTNLFLQQYQSNQWDNTTNTMHQLYPNQWNNSSSIHQWNNTAHSGQLHHVSHPYTYPPQPSSVSSLTSNMSHGSHVSSLSPQSTSSSASPSSIASINDGVGLYSGIPQVEHMSPYLGYYPSTYYGNNHNDYQLPIESSAFQSRPIAMDDLHLSRLRRHCEKCNCINCKHELAGLPPFVGPDQKGRKLHVCHYAGCKKAYLKTYYLKAHLRWHTGERPYTCTWINCTKRFSRSDELQRHLRVHTGEKPFTCKTCGKKFVRSDHLSNHSKIHTKKAKKSSTLTDNSSKLKTESPSVEEQGQIGNIIENIENLPKTTFSQELSILTNQLQAEKCANPVYSSQKSPLPLFYSHPPNQSSSLASHQYPSSVFYHYTNNISNSTDTSNRQDIYRDGQVIEDQNGTNKESQNGTDTSAYNDKYYDNYQYLHTSDASQAQVYHINYGNSHSYL